MRLQINKGEVIALAFVLGLIFLVKVVFFRGIPEETTVKTEFLEEVSPQEVSQWRYYLSSDDADIREMAKKNLERVGLWK